MKPAALFITALVLASLLGSPGTARADAAFGYLHNRSGNGNYDYLETIFPNSFASSISSLHDIVVLKPGIVDERLKKRGLALKKSYTPRELPKIADGAGADFFISGDFLPLPGNRIEIRLHICERKTREVFSFVNTGKMETEIFRLVERISAVVATYLRQDGLYKTRAIPAGTRVALISNLSGKELNRLYLPFLEKGFPVLCAQNNDIGEIDDGSRFSNLRYISTRTGSFAAPDDAPEAHFFHGPWNNAGFNRQVDETGRFFRLYDSGYVETKDKTLERFSKGFRDSVDVLLIVGFSEDRRTSWLRAIDMKDRNLMWMRSNIAPDSRFDDPVAAIGQKIADSMGTDTGPAPVR
ncbi:MAG: hypothetical protein MUC76_08400 [Spirochaetes bacterium]|nr:hypothetical protein [Spirochaetota bacterium]